LTFAPREAPPSIDCPSYIFKKFDPIVAPVKVFLPNFSPFSPLLAHHDASRHSMAANKRAYGGPTKSCELDADARRQHAGSCRFPRAINPAPLIEIIERYALYY
jgi:hypothetical protein